MTDRVGQRFGDYRLIRFLGKGSFGDVYLGENVDENTLAAVKVLQARLTPDDLKEFINETSTIFRMKHPNIVQLLDFGVGEDDAPFLVMDYAPNGTLRQRHPKGSQLQLATIVTFVKQIAAALQYAHDKNRIHRDVKPENILLGQNDMILLSDFGIAAVAHSTRSLNTQEGGGTIPYMAPEQIQGKPRPASDQYALGIIVYEWLCGGRPFIGSYWEIVTQHLSTPPASLREKVPTISPDVEQVVMTALAKGPKQRFASVQAFANALEQSCTPNPPKGTTLLTFGSPIGASAVAWSPDGTRIATGSDDRTVQVWDATTGATILIYRGHSDEVTALAWSPDGTCIASISDDKSLQVWDATTGATFPSIYHFDWWSNGVCTVTWSPDGSRIASGVGNEVQIWDAATGATLFSYGGHGANPLIEFRTAGKNKVKIEYPATRVHAVAWSPDGKRIASSAGAVQIWDAATGATLFTYTEHSYSVSTMAWSPDGKYIVSGSDDSTVQIWDGATGATLLTYTGHSYSSVNAVAWSPDGKCIASGSDDRTVQIWDAGTGNNFLTHSSHSERVNAVTWSPNGKQVASISFQAVRVWDATAGNTLLTYRGHLASVNAVVWSPDGRYIVASSSAYDVTSDEFYVAVQVWDAVTGATFLTYRGRSSDCDVNAVAWSPDGKRIASGFSDETVQIWDAATGATLLTYTEHWGGVEAVAWSPDGTRIASSGGAVQIWDAATGATLLTYRGHPNGALAVVWSPDGKYIASGSNDRTVQIWDAATGATLLTYTGHSYSVNAVAWSPDGKRIASGCSYSDKTVQIWDAATGATLLTYRGHQEFIPAVVWSPDGKYIASGSADKTVQVWDAITGHNIYTYHEHNSTVNALAYSPDGTRIASAGHGVHVWQAV